MQGQHGAEFMYSTTDERIELPHCNYSVPLEQAQWEEWNECLSGDLVGIGAQFEGQLPSAYMCFSK